MVWFLHNKASFATSSGHAHALAWEAPHEKVRWFQQGFHLTQGKPKTPFGLTLLVFVSSMSSVFPLLHLTGNNQLWFGFYTIRPSFASSFGQAVALGTLYMLSSSRFVSSSLSSFLSFST